MGILNVTPDSFSDGGLYQTPETILRQAEALCAAGADVLDIGGESTRPGSAGVSEEEELRRVVPVLRALSQRNFGVQLSIDTQKSAVARQALDLGATLVNDVSALGDPAMAALVQSYGAEVILMHCRGTPQTMQRTLTPYPGGVVHSVLADLEAAFLRAHQAGIPQATIWLDPGLGFGKTLEDNLALVGGLPELLALGQPLVVGPSRKKFLGTLVDAPRAADRDAATAALCAIAISKGAAMVRVHNVAAVRDAVRVASAVRQACGACI
jgi:dihydropteroate synthase